MKLYSENESYKLYEGSMLDMLEVIKPNSIDSIITDPPYELNFMNKGWDNSGIAFQPDAWKKCYEVLKPGGYLLAFGGSRTFHRIACAIEDAGFEIRDTIMWLYGSGFPKSMNLANSVESKLVNGNGNKNQFKKLDGEKGTPISYCSFTKKNIEQGFRNKDYAEQDYETTIKVNYTTDLAKQWDGWGTALKPSFEPIIVARKPFKSSLVDNVIKYGVGGLNIDECRVGDIGGVKKINIEDKSGSKNCGFGCNGKLEELNKGRFPANTILTYDETDYEEVCSNMYDIYENFDASRYFYCAKASKKDRDDGLEDFEATTDNAKGNGLDRICEYCGVSQLTPELCKCKTKSWITKPKKNIHPTVKPTELMQYLIRLTTASGGVILDCFNGSGSTGKAVMYENRERDKNYKYIGIELTPEYLPISKARIEYAINCKIDAAEEKINDNQLSLF